MKIKFVIFYLITAFISCDKSYELKINGEQKDSISFSCGNIITTCKSLGKRDFVIKQQYSLKEKVTLYKNAIEIIYKHDTIPFTILINSGKLTKPEFTANGNFELYLRFNIPGGINAGDTIYIKPIGFLNCNDKEVLINAIKLNLVNE